ncbi:hypothetical protein D9M71_242300 [compost metagenome]
MQQAVEQGEVGARAYLQEQVGLVRGGGAPGVDDDQAGAGLDPVHHAQEQDRVTVGHVRTADEEQVGAVEVLVGAGRRVGTERELVAAAGAGHAQARVGLDLVGADETLGQLVDQVLRLQRHLPGDIKGEGVRPVLVEDGAQAGGGGGDGFVNRRLQRVVAALVAQVGVFHPPRFGKRLVAGAALGAQAAEVARMALVTRHLHHAVVRDLHDDPAADAAIGTHAFYRSARHNLFPARNEKAPCRPPLDRGLHGAFVVGWGNRR